MRMIIIVLKTVTKKAEYRIAICQNGKFAVTFDTGKFINIKTFVSLIFNPSY